MTREEREVVERFALRQANRVLLEELMGTDIFQKIQSDLLTQKEQAFFLHLAQEEEADLRAYAKTHSHPKIARLLENVNAVQRILKK